MISGEVIKTRSEDGRLSYRIHNKWINIAWIFEELNNNFKDMIGFLFLINML